MRNSLFAIFAVIISTFFLYDSVSAGHCRRRDYRCCRKKVDYGRCYGHVRRWAYNVSCGECVPFDYSGCGGDENNFEYKDECSSCCKETKPCPRYQLPKPAYGCDYKWYDGPDVCPRPKLECQCPKTYCRPDSCRSGQRCVPVKIVKECKRCPCPQYQCVSDPCYAVSRHQRPCEKCVALPSPKCNEDPCPLVAYREDHCAPPPPPPPPRHHCSIVVDCPPQGDSCRRRSCHAYPKAKCVVDPCDCRKHWWSYYGKVVNDDECE
jgi:hypothetical protein